MINVYAVFQIVCRSLKSLSAVKNLVHLNVLGNDVCSRSQFLHKVSSCQHLMMLDYLFLVVHNLFLQTLVFVFTNDSCVDVCVLIFDNHVMYACLLSGIHTGQ